MGDKYILIGHEVKPEPDLLRWAEWYETAKRHVGNSYPIPGVHVSTVFLGIDHRFGGTGEPLLFETMIFGGDHDTYQERYSTWGEAEAGHKRALELISPDQSAVNEISGGKR